MVDRYVVTTEIRRADGELVGAAERITTDPDTAVDEIRTLAEREGLLRMAYPNCPFSSWELFNVSILVSKIYRVAVNEAGFQTLPAVCMYSCWLWLDPKRIDSLI